MIDHTQYFNVGQAATGEVHAASGLWGPALCDTPLLVVDDNRRYTSDELRCLAVCPGCLGVALVRSRGMRERLDRPAS
jgi:hypothetical protein